VVVSAEAGQRWVALLTDRVLGKVLVVSGAVDGPIWIVLGQRQGIRPNVNAVIDTTIGPQGRLVNEESGLGILTIVGGTPEGSADQELSRYVGI
jgi:hypothetical protein